MVNAICRLVEVGGEDDRPRTVRRSDVWLVGRSWSFVRNRCRFLRRVQRLIYDNQWTLISGDRLLAASLLNVNLIEHSTVVVGDGGSEQSKAEAFVGQTTEFMADPAQIEYINPFTSSDCMQANGSRAGWGAVKPENASVQRLSLNSPFSRTLDIGQVSRLSRIDKELLFDDHCPEKL